MTRRLTALAAAALALILLSALSGPAEAHRRGHQGLHGGWQGSVPHLHFRHHHHRHSFVGVPSYYYGPYYYSDGCYWLRRRALATGSPYWWDRYYACIGGYYPY